MVVVDDDDEEEEEDEGAAESVRGRFARGSEVSSENSNGRLTVALAGGT